MILESFCWDHFGIILESFWDHFIIILESFLDHFGTILLGSFWDHFEIILESFWDHFGTILGSMKINLCSGNEPGGKDNKNAHERILALFWRPQCLFVRQKQNSHLFHFSGLGFEARRREPVWIIFASFLYLN